MYCIAFYLWTLFCYYCILLYFISFLSCSVLYHYDEPRGSFKLIKYGRFKGCWITSGIKYTDLRGTPFHYESQTHIKRKAALILKLIILSHKHSSVAYTTRRLPCTTTQNNSSQFMKRIVLFYFISAISKSFGFWASNTHRGSTSLKCSVTHNPPNFTHLRIRIHRLRVPIPRTWLVDRRWAMMSLAYVNVNTS